MATAKHKSNGDLARDIEQIKYALHAATHGMKSRANDTLVNSMDEICHSANEVKANVVDYTTREPVKSLGIALLAGIAIGFLLRK